MKKILLISAILLFPEIGIQAAINPFKPYRPLSKIDYSLNRSLGKDTSSMAFKPESFTKRILMPAGMLVTSILFDDYLLDKRIVKTDGIKSPSMWSANVLQFSPGILLYALKASGLESRSDWPRMITADIASGTILLSMVQAAKYTFKRERPDGRAYNSYPSGHTATAFMCAQMLHKEYGETVSPWISVAGYGIAATTGIFRVISNRHWCSDVLAGAALGIFSTELGYDLTDILFGNHGLKKSIVVPEIDDLPKWKYGLYSDYSIGADVFTSGGYGNPNAKPACSIGIDASWMPWRIGPTVRAGLTQMKWTGTYDLYLPPQGSVTDVYTLGAGLDMDIPVISILSINGQAIAGYSPSTNSYSFQYQDQPLEWDIPAGFHCYANIGMTVRTTSFSSITVHGGLDYYDKVWRSFAMGARFIFTF